MRARELLARDEVPLEGRVQSEVVPALSWITKVDPASIRISLDGDIDSSEKHPVALDFRVPREGCDSSRTVTGRR